MIESLHIYMYRDWQPCSATSTRSQLCCCIEPHFCIGLAGLHLVIDRPIMLSRSTWLCYCIILYVYIPVSIYIFLLRPPKLFHANIAKHTIMDTRTPPRLDRTTLLVRGCGEYICLALWPSLLAKTNPPQNYHTRMRWRVIETIEASTVVKIIHSVVAALI